MITINYSIVSTNEFIKANELHFLLTTTKYINILTFGLAIENPLVDVIADLDILNTNKKYIIPKLNKKDWFLQYF